MANIALKVGIDVSKSKFDVCYRSGNGTVSKTYSSGARSVKEFVSSLPEGSHCVMEATGCITPVSPTPCTRRGL